MGNNNIGVLTTNNAPSSLTKEEKALRRQRRALEHELEFQSQRARRFEREVESDNPVQRAAAEAQLELARQRVSECEMGLAELEQGAVN